MLFEICIILFFGTHDNEHFTPATETNFNSYNIEIEIPVNKSVISLILQ